MLLSGILSMIRITIQQKRNDKYVMVLSGILSTIQNTTNERNDNGLWYNRMLITLQRIAFYEWRLL